MKVRVGGMNVRELGEFIRNQRMGEHLSLRALSAVAGVSIPYLSQIERGLRRPSADILQAIAKGLRVSSQTLYVQAGILDQAPHPDVHEAVMGDPRLTERQKQALLSVYDSFAEETARQRAGRATPAGTTRRGKASGNGAPSRRSRNKASGRAETQADPKPSPGSPPSSRSQSTRRSKGGRR